jgi:acyl-CoA thioesterase-1
VVGDSAKYNEVASRVMMEIGGIEIDDMFVYAKENAAKIQRKADVHYTPEGSRFLAKRVSQKIEQVLEKKR